MTPGLDVPNPGKLNKGGDQRKSLTLKSWHPALPESGIRHRRSFLLLSQLLKGAKQSHSPSSPTTLFFRASPLLSDYPDGKLVTGEN